MKGNPLDFSFSGLKTAVLRWFEQSGLEEEVARRRALLESTPQPSIEQWLEVTSRQTLDALASFQWTVIEELMRRTAASAEQSDARSILVTGGVACNTALRNAAGSSRLPVPVYFPTPALSTDNAAMIAAAAFDKLQRGLTSDFTLRAKANLSLV
jgi:N6-L-threonylcarbamoyladenine synthase